MSRFQIASLTSIRPVHHTYRRFTVAYSNRGIFILYFRTAAVSRHVRAGTVVIARIRESNKNSLEHRVSNASDSLSAIYYLKQIHRGFIPCHFYLTHFLNQNRSISSIEYLFSRNKNFQSSILPSNLKVSSRNLDFSQRPLSFLFYSLASISKEHAFPGYKNNVDSSNDQVRSAAEPQGLLAGVTGSRG